MDCSSIFSSTRLHHNSHFSYLNSPYASQPHVVVLKDLLVQEMVYTCRKQLDKSELRGLFWRGIADRIVSIVAVVELWNWFRRFDLALLCWLWSYLDQALQRCQIGNRVGLMCPDDLLLWVFL